MRSRFSPTEGRLDPTLLEPSLISGADLCLLLLADVGGEELAYGPEARAILGVFRAFSGPFDLAEALRIFNEAQALDAEIATRN